MLSDNILPSDSASSPNRADAPTTPLPAALVFALYQMRICAPSELRSRLMPENVRRVLLPGSFEPFFLVDMEREGSGPDLVAVLMVGESP